MSNLTVRIRVIRMRWHADQPPMPLGCRWCGHSPYAHQAASLPHRPDHEWEQPTPAQVDARMRARRRLGLSRPLPTATPVRPWLRPDPHEPVPDRHRRHEQPALPYTTVAPYRRGRPPGVRTSSGEHPHQPMAAA
ncbi:hypothetical protein AB0M95_17970 [Sphaerisporangium sp. NPDC051017]|uniref:hypothetical protein n=1 Tax=Sphaerisporangium sp. NPDC051017 TaxID=3154636 RepID=UPI003415E873